MRVIIVHIVPEFIDVHCHFVTFSILLILRFGPAFVPSRRPDKGWRKPSTTSLKTPSLTHILWPDWAHPSSTSQDEAINTVLHRWRVTAVTRLRWCAVINIMIKSPVPTRFTVVGLLHCRQKLSSINFAKKSSTNVYVWLHNCTLRQINESYEIELNLNQ